MDTNNTVIIITTILIIIVLAYYLYNNNSFNGFWLANDEFLLESDLEYLLLYLDSKSSGYMIMKNAEGVLINEPFKLEYTFKSKTYDYVLYEVNFKWEDDKDFDYFPNKQLLRYYNKKGKVILYDKKEVTAILYKDYYLADTSS